MVRDTAALAGLLLLTLGLGMIYLPLAAIAAGGLLLAAAVWGHVNDPRSTAGTGEATGDEDPRPPLV
jgi:hypothetical protein